MILGVAVTLARSQPVPLSNADRQAMLDAHNDARAAVSPPAADMVKAVWADDLEKLAYDWVDKCVWKHPEREPGSPYRGIGQNLAKNLGFDLTFAGLADGWLREIKYFTYQNNTCHPGTKCGHYTQMVWATSKEIGCAWKKCDNLFPGHPLPGYILACQYRAPGNVIGRQPYQEGPSCSKCPAGATCENKLCVDSSLSTIPHETTQAATPITDKDRQDLVKYINDRRLEVDPPAANMMEVKYSQQMEDLAAEYATMCMNRLPCPNTYPQYNPYGTTLALAPADKSGLLEMASEWWDARAQYDFKTDSCTGYCHHYKQLVWAATYEVGCAWSTCDHLQPSWQKPVKFLVCMYNYCGGFGGKRPYTDGSTCSNCFYGQKCEDRMCKGTPTYPPQKFSRGMHMMYW